MEMKISYPDLAFRGRPLVRNKPFSSSDAQTASENSKVAEVPRKDSAKGMKAADTTVINENDNNNGKEVFVDSGRSSRCNESNNDGTTLPGQNNSRGTDGSGVDDELSGPQAISLHITLRNGSKGENSTNPGEPQPPAEPSAGNTKRKMR